MYYSQGKLDLALREFLRVTRFDTDNRIALHHIARIHAMQRRYRDSIDTVRRLQESGVAIQSDAVRETLRVVLNGVLQISDLKERADRLAISVPFPGGDWQALTGNQIGCLLAEFLLHHRGDRSGPVINSVVSSPLLARIAERSSSSSNEPTTLAARLAPSRPPTSHGSRPLTSFASDSLALASGATPLISLMSSSTSWRSTLRNSSTVMRPITRSSAFNTGMVCNL